MKSKESEFAMMNSKGIISQIFKIKNIKIQMLLTMSTRETPKGDCFLWQPSKRLGLPPWI